LPEPPGRCGKQKKASSSFLQKRTKKLLFVLTRTFPAKSATAQTKAFCFFFQKEVLSSCRCISLK
jgi:hypothetical protein